MAKLKINIDKIYRKLYRVDKKFSKKKFDALVELGCPMWQIRVMEKFPEMQIPDIEVLGDIIEQIIQEERQKAVEVWLSIWLDEVQESLNIQSDAMYYTEGLSGIDGFLIELEKHLQVKLSQLQGKIKVKGEEK